MTDDTDEADYQRWAFSIEPQLEQRGESWTAWYPEAGWTVSAATETEALRLLKEEYSQRRNVDQNHFADRVAVFRRHLQRPIPGVYAMDNELYRELRHEGADEADIKRAFAEAERRRLAGRTYTKTDYLASSA